jgi:hypothetical protein
LIGAAEGLEDVEGNWIVMHWNSKDWD